MHAQANSSHRVNDADVRQLRLSELVAKAQQDRPISAQDTEHNAWRNWGNRTRQQ